MTSASDPPASDLQPHARPPKPDDPPGLQEDPGSPDPIVGRLPSVPLDGRLISGRMVHKRFFQIITIIFGTILGVGLGGLVWFAQTLPAGPPEPEGADRRYAMTDAVVVWTGGRERMETGLSLVVEGAAKQLLVSGVHQQVGQRDLKEWLKGDARVWDCCVRLGYQAGDTRGNAGETAAWMRANGYISVRLVTANYHMPRSLLELRVAMPEAVIIAHPVAPSQVRVGEWWRRPGTIRLIAQEYLKFLASFAYHSVVRGWDRVTSRGF